MMRKLEQYRVEKPWGRDDLIAPFDDPRRIGEIWFQNDKTASTSQCDALLVKYLFTSEKLSVQVHPDDDTAMAQGLRSGKTECWYILQADDDARLGLGLKTTCSKDALRKAALSGEIEHMLDWKSTKAGDIWFVPPGTIHAIGGGLKLVEVQQNADITYRLYDYGRPRELHLDAAMQVAHAGPYDMANHIAAGKLPQLNSAHFCMHLVTDAHEYPAPTKEQHILIPLDDGITLCGQTLHAGDVYYAGSDNIPEWHAPAKLLIAWPIQGDNILGLKALGAP
jgi:mannose-6-phosphate isomerase